MWLGGNRGKSTMPKIGVAAIKGQFLSGPGGGFGESDGNREAMGSSSQL